MQPNPRNNGHSSLVEIQSFTVRIFQTHEAEKMAYRLVLVDAAGMGKEFTSPEYFDPENQEDVMKNREALLSTLASMIYHRTFIQKPEPPKEKSLIILPDNNIERP